MCWSNFCHLHLRLAAFVLLCPNKSVARRFNAQLHTECIDNGDTNAVQSARNFVSIAAELSSGMQHGVHDFKCILSS